FHTSRPSTRTASRRRDRSTSRSERKDVHTGARKPETYRAMPSPLVVVRTNHRHARRDIAHAPRNLLRRADDAGRERFEPRADDRLIDAGDATRADNAPVSVEDRSADAVGMQFVFLIVN